ncbi:unnamed protein product [Vicia faba]|uniref:Uncharacterized protein n=1 Tax=Vicia faba TaxID=3906 RepID=A0AAV0Z9A5_VICFA|nr:unnamed protein product [Vicia faba]
MTDHITWPFLEHAYTESATTNHDEQSPESGVDRGGGRGNDSGRGNEDDHAFQAINFDQWKQSSSTRLPLTTEQLDKLFKLLESPTSSCSIATKAYVVDMNTNEIHITIHVIELDYYDKRRY